MIFHIVNGLLIAMLRRETPSPADHVRTLDAFGVRLGVPCDDDKKTFVIFLDKPNPAGLVLFNLISESLRKIVKINCLIRFTVHIHWPPL